jgi:hypothetical protein
LRERGTTIVDEFLAAFLIFLCLLAASLGCLAVYDKLPRHHREEETYNVVRLTAGIFVVMTSLVLGLLINSAKNKFEANDRNLRALATELILLERTLRQYGPDATDTRQHLRAYVQRVLDNTWPATGTPVIDDGVAERLLDEAERGLNAIRARDAERAELWLDAKRRLQRVLELRWDLVEGSGGGIPPPLLVMLVAWLMLIFASFGYRAPKNLIVVATFVLSSLLISGSLYLTMDMDLPFTGPMRISPAPLQRVIDFMKS